MSGSLFDARGEPPEARGARELEDRIGTRLATARHDRAPRSRPALPSCSERPRGGCPQPYAERHVVYAGVDDGRGCAPCTCGAPDSACSATLRIFGDDEGGGLCTKPRVLELALSAAGPTCGDLPDAGLAIGSERVVGLEYDAGSCAPGGGQPAGEAAPSGPATFCCLASA